MKDLMFSFFANRATPLQKREVDKWIKEGENKRVYWQWLEEWENQNPEYQPDLEKHLTRFVTFMREHTNDSHKSEVKILTSEKAKINYWKFSMAAAVIVMLMGIGGWVFKDYFLYRQYKTAYSESRTLVLEDGSIVTLSENSSIKVLRRNFKSHREVYLTGEANFSVTHAVDGKQFVVKTGNQFEVKVTGTEFSVLASKRGSKVLLTKGKVEVDYLDNNKHRRMALKQGDVMTFNRDRCRGRPIITHFNTEGHASMIWKHRRFEFNNTALNEMADMLHDTYGFEVKLADPKLGEQKLSGSYTADNLEDLLQAIGEMMEVNIEREGNQLNIKARN